MLSRMKSVSFIAGALAIAIAGCASSEPASSSTAATPATAAAAPPAKPTTVEEQLALGQKAYGQFCAGCHGPGGQGTEQAPAVVGAGALPLDPPATRKARKSQFHTAADIATFVVATMPPPPKDKEKPSVDEYWAILAFDLSANGVKPTQIVGPDNAASFVIHP